MFFAGKGDSRHERQCLPWFSIINKTAVPSDLKQPGCLCSDAFQQTMYSLYGEHGPVSFTIIHTAGELTAD